MKGDHAKAWLVFESVFVSSQEDCDLWFACGEVEACGIVTARVRGYIPWKSEVVIPFDDTLAICSRATNSLCADCVADEVICAVVGPTMRVALCVRMEVWSLVGCSQACGCPFPAG